MTAKTVKKSTAPTGKNLVKTIKSATKKSASPAKKAVTRPVNKDIPSAMCYGGYSKRETFHKISSEMFNRIGPRPLQWFVAFKNQLIFGFSESGTAWVLEVVDEKHAEKLYKFAQEQQGYRFAGMTAGAKMLVGEVPAFSISKEEIAHGLASVDPYKGKIIEVEDPLQYLEDLTAKALSEASAKQEPEKKRNLYEHEKKWIEELCEIERNKPISSPNRIHSGEFESMARDYNKKVKGTIEQYLTKGRFNVEREILWTVYLFFIDNRYKFTDDLCGMFSQVPIELLKFFSDPKISEQYQGSRDNLLLFIDLFLEFVNGIKDTEAFSAWLEMMDVDNRGEEFMFRRLKGTEEEYKLEIRKLEVEEKAV